MNLIMDQQSNSKQNFFQKSPDISLIESPALSLFKGLSKKFLEQDASPKLNKLISNNSIKRPSPCISSIMPTPIYDPLGLQAKNFLQNSNEPMKLIKLDIIPFGTPEIEFGLGPSALEVQKASKKLIESCSVFDKHT